MSEEGTIELKIERFSKFARDKNPTTQDRLSAPTYIFDLPWKILAYPRSTTGNGAKNLAFFLRCNEEDDDTNWSCHASAKLQIVSQTEGVDDLVYEYIHNFTSKNYEYGYPDLIRCNVLLNPQTGFIKDDVVILRAHVNAKMLKSPHMSKLGAFASSISDLPDGTLIVGTNKISIHKMYLSYYSEYFKTMFRSEFKEKREDEIVIEEVRYGEMLELLDVVYPSRAPITDKNLKSILKLADRFIMPSILNDCKNVLKTSALNGAQKLLMAQQYNFKDLLKEFAQQCKTVADAKKVKTEPEYKLLDSDTRLLIFDSITS